MEPSKAAPFNRGDSARRPVPARSADRYTEEQLVEILKRAAQRQEGLVTEPDGRFSLEEIQQIASEVGIAPSHVATAAAEVATVPPPRSGALGAPTAFRFERWINGEVSRSAISDLLDLARRETGIQGTMTEALDSIEWRGKGQLDSTIVSITPRDGRTKITVALTRSESAALAVTGGSIGEAIRNGIKARYLQPGDVVEIEVEGIGVLRNTVGPKVDEDPNYRFKAPPGS